MKVVEIPGSGLGAKFKPLGGLAVVARNTWAAIQGRDALTIEWEAGPQGTASTAMQEQELRDSANGPGDPVRDQGDAEAALASAARVFTREYYQPHLAHAPMERSEEHTSELQSLMRISYAVFCLKKKKDRK